jgi:hydroxymethylbilane synthase
MVQKTIYIGARKSALSLAQTSWVVGELKKFNPGYDFQIKPFTTAGDRRDQSMAIWDQPGIFVKEIEEALLRFEVDIAVHSLKDMPCLMHEKLELGAVTEREDARESFISREGTLWSKMPAQSRIGTSSIRRRAQILSMRSDMKLVDLRGNVDTRLKKLADGQMDAMILACAGLIRLGLVDKITERLSMDMMLPAPCQGALALEVRRGDDASLAFVKPLDHAATNIGIMAERVLLQTLGGGCNLPLGAWGRVENERLVLRAQVVKPDGSRKIQKELSAGLLEAQALGRKMAQELLGAEGGWVKDVLAACSK